MKKNKFVYVSVIAMLIFSIVIANPITANAIGTILPTKSAVTLSGVVVTGNTNPRLVEINRVLGIPLTQLQKLSAAEVKSLIITNADKLGVQVYNSTIDTKTGEVTSVLVAGTTVFKPLDYVKTVTVTPTPYPYPAPGMTTVVNIETLTTTSIHYLPLVMNSGGDTATLANVSSRMLQAKSWVDNQYMDNSTLGIVKEYPGCPLSIQNTDNPNGLYSKRFAGEYYISKLTPVGKVLSNVVGYQFDWSDYTFEAGDNITSGWNYDQPSLNCDLYYVNGVTTYIVTKTAWDNTGPNLHQRLYLGDTLLFSDIASTPNGTTASITTPVGGRFAAARFTIRHATSLGALFYEKYTDPWKVQQLNATIATYGFNTLPDIYAPLFEVAYNNADDYMFTNDAYHDCDLINAGMDSTIALGYLPYRYAYESKVCVIGRTAYITLSRGDYLVPALQAIHILNKYGDADHSYVSPSGVGTTTPRQIARWLESKYNGYGIPVYLKDTQYASGIRTNAFLALEAKLGFSYGDIVSQVFADATANTLMMVQWGSSPNAVWTGTTMDNGLLYRPIHQGGELLMWGSNFTLAPSGGILTDIVDMFSMPNESIMPQPSNSETTMSYWAALQLYKKYKYNSP